MNNCTLYIGCKNVENRVRCILDHSTGNYYYPPYSKEPEWRYYNEKYVSVSSFLIAKERTENSYMQCWSVSSQTYYLSSEQFEEFLRKLQ